MRVWAVSDVHTDYKENMAWYDMCFGCMFGVPLTNMVVDRLSYWLHRNDPSSIGLMKADRGLAGVKRCQTMHTRMMCSFLLGTSQTISLS